MLRVASGPRSKRVFIEAYDAVDKLQCRGKSIAASIPFGSFDQQKGRKKVSKQERRAIVEAFVDNYRVSNPGRFPTASHARQHTGGSYYTVKQIIQELEYNLRISAPNEHKGTQLGKTEKVNDPTCSVELDGLSRSSKMVSLIADKHPLDLDISLNGNMDQVLLVKNDEEIELLEAKQPLLCAKSEVNYDAVDKVQCRGKSIPASIPFGSFDQQKGRKKVSKQERRAIVEAFVDNYRVSNQGTFPTASHARQHTGGSYYTVKQIIQELEYNLRISAPSEHKGTQLGKTEKVNDPTCSVELDGLSRSSKMVSLISDKHPLDLDISLNGNMDQVLLVKNDEEIELLEAKQPLLCTKSEVNEVLSPQTTIPNLRSEENVEICSIKDPMMNDTQIGISNQNRTLQGLANGRMEYDQDSVRFSLSVSSVPSDTIVVAKEPSKPCDSEDCSADQLASLKLEGDATCSPTREIECRESKNYAESFQGVHNKEYKQANSHEIPKSDEHTGDHLKVSERSKSSPKGLNLWGNLKSLADGIAKFWKKM